MRRTKFISMIIRGTVKRLTDIQIVESPKGNVQKRTVVLEKVQEKRTKLIAFDVWGELCSYPLLSIGKMITAEIDIESKEFNNKFYNTIRAWRIN
jgi:hypothetical protein